MFIYIVCNVPYMRGMGFEKETSAGYLANHMARLFAAGLQRRIKPLGLAPGQFPALLALWSREGRTQKELVSLLDIEQATLANTLARMERDGLIQRRPSEDDGRVQKIFLTEAAKVLEAPAIEAALATNKAALSGLSGEEQIQFLKLMRRAIAGLQKAEDAPS